MTRQLAAIDVGSNAIRIVIASHELETLYSERVPLSLGAEVFANGKICKETTKDLLHVFGGFAYRLKTHEVSAVRAVATSAMRNSKNADKVIDKIEDHTGIKIEVIDGSEELRIVQASLGEQIERCDIVADLGGGSLDLGQRNGKNWSYSTLPLGTLNVINHFSLPKSLSEPNRKLLKKYVYDQLDAASVGQLGDRELAVTGGNALALSKIVGEAPGLQRRELKEWIEANSGKSPKDLIADYDLRRDRAEVINVAAVVIYRLMKHTKAKYATTPKAGVRDGILVELAKKPVERQ